MSTYTPTPVFPVSYVIPDDGDPKTASSVNIALEALGDRTQYLFLRGGKQVADYAAIKAILAPADGDRVYCIFGGDWVFKTLGAGPDNLFNLVPTDGTPGAWIASAYTGILGFANGIPYMAGGKILPGFIPYVCLFEDAVANVPSAGDVVAPSVAYVDVTGASITFTATAGDLIFVESHALLLVDSGAGAGTNVTWSSTIIDPSAGTVLKTMPWAVLGSGDFNMRSQIFKYVAVGTGTYTVKGQIKSGGSYNTRVYQGSASMHVRVVRP